MLSIPIMGTTYHQTRRSELMRAFRPNRVFSSIKAD